MKDDPKPPDLQEWVARHGGYNRIPWDQWDKAMAEYQQARREILLQEISRGKSP
jgi:hypothetical protein